MLILCRRGPEVSPEMSPPRLCPPSHHHPRLELEDSLCHLENVLGAAQCDLHHTSAFYSHSFLRTFSATRGHCKTPLVQLLGLQV